MRVLFITNFHLLYGANRSLLSLMDYFKKQGSEVCMLLNKKGDLNTELERKRINYIIAPYLPSILYYKHFERIWLYFAKIISDAVTIIVFPYILFRVWRYKPDLIYSNSCADNLGILIAKFLGKKHVTHVRDFMDLDHGLKFVFGNRAKRKYINMSDAVIYVSYSVAKHTQLSESLPANHKVIYNGVKNVERQYQEKKLPQQIDLGIVGILDESKGQHIAISYFKSILKDYPESRLHIWGNKEGPYKQKLYQLISELDIQEKVVFHGFERNTDVIYENMDALLMFSKMEGFGRVTIEAMQRGIPVIGFNSGGTSELVKNGYNGFLFSNEEDFISGIKNLFCSNEVYNKICYQAYTDAKQNYSEELYAKKVYDFVNETMSMR